MARTIWINALDRQRLDELFEKMTGRVDAREVPHIEELKKELESARTIKDVKKTPADVMTMRSVARLRNEETGKSSEYRLVYPAEANAEMNAISVLAPLGTAMLGHKVGSKFKVALPKGMTTFVIEEITYQPEAAGDYHL